MDTRFSMAIQLLILTALAPEPMSSAQMAGSVGTNPSHVRRILGQLSKAGFVEGRQGTVGFRLLQDPQDVSLFSVYCAVCGTDAFHAFDVHQNSSDACLVGRYIRPVLHDIFGTMEQRMQEALAGCTLADCINRLKTCVASDDPTANEGSISDTLRQKRDDA